MTDRHNQDRRRILAGFGLRETSAVEETRRMAAARAVAVMLRNEAMPTFDEDRLEAFSVCKGIFNRVLRQDQPDWFVSQVRLGYPSGDRCGQIAAALSECRTAVKEGDVEGWRASRLDTRRLRTRRSLAAYRGRRVLETVPGSGFVVVMSRREEPDLLRVAVSAAPILEEAARVNAERPDAPLGVRAFWWVSDVAAATSLVGSVMDDRAETVGEGLYRAGFHAVRNGLNRELSTDGILMDPFASLVSRTWPGSPAPG